MIFTIKRTTFLQIATYLFRFVFLYYFYQEFTYKCGNGLIWCWHTYSDYLTWCIYIHVLKMKLC